MKKQTGIWLDSKEAFLVDIIGETVEVRHLVSEVDDGRTHGGSRSNVPYGPMDVHSDTKILERRKQQFHYYFEEIKKAVADSAEIFLFGPSEAKIGLEKAMREDHSFLPGLLAVQTSDSLTRNQLVAHVRAFFKMAETV